MPRGARAPISLLLLAQHNVGNGQCNLVSSCDVRSVKFAVTVACHRDCKIAAILMQLSLCDDDQTQRSEAEAKND